MKKIGLGLLLGAVLGAVDGATSWFTPEVRGMLLEIIMGSMIKDAVVGAICGIFALKVHSAGRGAVFGSVVGCAFAFVVAYLQHAHYAEIMLPGTVVGMILGYATGRSGAAGGATA
jgi:ABC-type molybdate transport system permease subunit